MLCESGSDCWKAFSLSFFPASTTAQSLEAKHGQPGLNYFMERGHLFQILELGHSALLILGSCENFVLVWFFYLSCIYICFSGM